MANWSDPRTTAVPRAAVGAREAAFDAGLRAYMLSVYNYMASGVLLTGLVAMLFVQTGYAYALLPNPIVRFVLMLAPLGVVMWMSFGINRITEGTAKALYWTYAVLMGLSLSSILLVYTGTSVAQAFFASAAGFAGLSLVGYTTKKDLSAMGSFFIMGVFGLFVAMLLNMFLKSDGLSLLISLVGVVLFAGLTAYDTQRIKSGYFQVRGTALMGKSAVMGALQLYLDFINMFLFLLRLFGSRR